MSNSKQFVLFCGAIFLVTLGVRFLTWQDNYHDIGKVQIRFGLGKIGAAFKVMRQKTVTKNPQTLSTC